MRGRVGRKRPVVCTGVSAAWRFDVFFPLAFGGKDVEDCSISAFPSIRQVAAHAEEILRTLLHPIWIEAVHAVFTLLRGWSGGFRPLLRRLRRLSRVLGGGGG